MSSSCYRVSILSIVLIFFAVTPAAALSSCDGVGVSCTLDDLGNGRFQYTFEVVNGSPDAIAIFKWNVDPPNVSSSWQTVSFELPTGWEGDHPDSHLDFMVFNNGDLNPDRIFSPSVASCGASPSLTFSWTFDRTDGPAPACFGPLDYTLHYQPINVADCRNAGATLTCPGVIPVEPATWGKIRNLYR